MLVQSVLLLLVLGAAVASVVVVLLLLLLLLLLFGAVVVGGAIVGGTVLWLSLAMLQLAWCYRDVIGAVGSSKAVIVFCGVSVVGNYCFCCWLWWLYQQQ